MENNIDDLFKNKINQIDKLPENINWNKEKGLKDFQKQFITKKNNMRKLLIYSLSIAASLLIIFMAIYSAKFIPRTPVFVFNKSNKVRKVVLSDGNIAWLNKNSSIQFPKKTYDDVYKVDVKGEVYFEINKRPKKHYIVKAYNTIINIEDKASLNIRAYSKEASVDITVADGAVKIGEETYPEGLAILVTEGNFCSVHKKLKVVFSSVNKNLNYLSWKTGKLVFDSTYIETVADVLEKYYHKQIILENDSIAYCYFSGTFDNQSIDIILNKMESNLGIKINKTGNKIILSGKSCFTN